MFRCSIVWLGLAMAGSAAQALPLRQRDLGQICADDIARFCPALSVTSVPRNLRICLKPYHSSLAISCRHALAATN